MQVLRLDQGARESELPSLACIVAKYPGDELSQPIELEYLEESMRRPPIKGFLCREQVT